MGSAGGLGAGGELFARRHWLQINRDSCRALGEGCRRRRSHCPRLGVFHSGRNILLGSEAPTLIPESAGLLTPSHTVLNLFEVGFLPWVMRRTLSPSYPPFESK